MILFTILLAGTFVVSVHGAPPFGERQPSPPPFFVQLPGGEIVATEPDKLRPVLLSNGTWALFLEPQNVTIPFPKQPDSVVGPPMPLPPPMGSIMPPPMPRFGGGGFGVGFGAGFGGRFPFGGPSPFGPFGRPPAIDSIISGLFGGGPFGGGGHRRPGMGPWGGKGKRKDSSSSVEEGTLNVVVGGEGVGPEETISIDTGSDFPQQTTDDDGGESETVAVEENLDRAGGDGNSRQIPSPQGQIPMPEQGQEGGGSSSPTQGLPAPAKLLVAPGEQQPQQPSVSVSEKSVNVTTTTGAGNGGDGVGGGDGATDGDGETNGEDDTMPV